MELCHEGDRLVSHLHVLDELKAIRFAHHNGWNLDL